MMSANADLGTLRDPDSGSNTAGPGPRILRDLERSLRQMWQFQLVSALARTGSILVCSLSLLALSDWMWVLPRPVRALAVSLAVMLALVRLVQCWPRLDRTGVAAAVERGFPELGQRVVTTVEYAEPGRATAPASPGLVQALFDETDERTAGLDYRRLIPWPVVRRRVLVVVLTVLPVAVGLCFWPELRTAALRALLLPASYSMLEVEPGDATIPAGADFNLVATVRGRPVRSARCLTRPTGSSGPWTGARLIPAAKEGKQGQNGQLVGSLTTRLADCQSDLEYRVVAGELESPVYHLRVIHPLTISTFEVRVTPPSYTRRPQAVHHDRNIRVIEGSEVQFILGLNRPARSAALVLGMLDDPSRRTVPLAIQGTKLLGSLSGVTIDQPYTILATADDRVTLDPASYRIQVQPDEPPTLRFIRPDEELAVVPTSEVPIQVEAGDDFGLTHMGIAYKVGDGREESLYGRDAVDQPPTARALATLYLEKHKMSYTDSITYYAFVEDNRPPRPHRVVSELRFLDILPYKQAYQLVEGGGT
jgi:hypothetical protein